MTVREATRRGKRILVIDIPYTKPDGSADRYRRDSKATTKSAAREEEKRILDRIARTGSPFEAPEAPDALTETPSPSPPPIVPTFADIAAQYRTTYMLTDLKVTTRRGYESVLDSVLLPRFGKLPITAVDGSAAARLDLELAKKGGERKDKLSRSTRNNAQIVLRSVLRWAHGQGHLSARPSGLPRLKKVEQSILEIPSDQEVQLILATASPSHQLSFGLMAYAGLRPNEVRALRRSDLQLRWENGQLTGGFVGVREGKSFDELHTPKTGRREIPIAPPLARLLAPVAEGPRDGYVALSKRGKPWGQYGLDQAFERVRERAGLAGWSVYALRHYAITSWLRRGIPIHVVQKMAGHRHLSTTQRYVHFLKEDLEEAARRMAEASPKGELFPSHA